jgi:hypothetical protein
MEKSSSGAASTTLMVSLLFGCTVAKPPDAVGEGQRLMPSKMSALAHTEELLGCLAGRLDDLNDTRTERLDGRHVVREDTHVARARGQVDLQHVLGREQRLCRRSASASQPYARGRTDLVRERERERDLVRGLGVAAAAESGGGNRGAPGDGREHAEGGHGGGGGGQRRRRRRWRKLRDSGLGKRRAGNTPVTGAKLVSSTTTMIYSSKLEFPFILRSIHLFDSVFAFLGRRQLFGGLQPRFAIM